MNSHDYSNHTQFLKNQINELAKENKRLKTNIQRLQDLFGYEICKYFNKCNSIKDTADHFYFESVNECYHALVEYYGCTDPLVKASDYNLYFNEIFTVSSENV